MKHAMHGKRRTSAARFFSAALLVGVFVSSSSGVAGAVQLIPSLGFTKSTEGNSGDGKFNAGMALRAPLLPFLSAEGGSPIATSRSPTATSRSACGPSRRRSG